MIKALTLPLRQMILLQIPMHETNQVPNRPKEQPTSNKTKRERKQRISPLNIDQGRKNILQKLKSVLSKFMMSHIAVPIFKYHSFTVISEIC